MMLAIRFFVFALMTLLMGSGCATVPAHSFPFDWLVLILVLALSFAPALCCANWLTKRHPAPMSDQAIGLGCGATLILTAVFGNVLIFIVNWVLSIFWH